MDWDYFRPPGKDGFQLKRLPPITKPFRVTDRTEISDYRVDFKGLSFRQGVEEYQRCFRDGDDYEIEVEEAEEFLAKLNQKALGTLYPFKADPEALLSLYEAHDDEDAVQLDGKLADYGLKAGLVSIDPMDDSWYLPTPLLVREVERLALDLVHELEDNLKNYPIAYQQGVMRILAEDLEPGGLFEKAIAAADKSSALRIRKAAAEDEFGRVRVWPKRTTTTDHRAPQPEPPSPKTGHTWYIVLALTSVLVFFVLALSM